MESIASSVAGESAREPVTLSQGAVVADRYRVEGLVGEGGMGAVYRVVHMRMHKVFALKVLHAAASDSPEIVARFEREAVAAGSIDHPNVAVATDFGQLPDGSFFLVSEFIAGRSLRAELAVGPLDAARALGIMRGVVAAVAAAHAKRIVHRDLKPENIMLVRRDGDGDFVKVIDFGIAKVSMPEETKPEGVREPLTRIGAIMGTPEYMSPEQALGQPVDGRADLYSLGVIFFELLAGRCPFEGDVVSVIRQHLTAEPPPLPQAVVRALDARVPLVIQRLLAKDAAMRFQTADELAAALAEVAASPRVSVPQAGLLAAQTAPTQFDVSVLPSSVGKGRPTRWSNALAADAKRIAAWLIPRLPPSVRPHATTRRVLVGMASVVSMAVLGPLILLSFLLTGASPPETDPSVPTTASASSTSARPPAPRATSPATAEVAPPDDSAATSPSASASSYADSESLADAGPAPKPSRRRRTVGGIYIPSPKTWFK
jgi:serine/threonine-protein kinase